MRLFISHAFEDKAGFVRPLVTALQPSYEVWFDAYELTIGDSLLRKISDGLNACDYGIVVLSPHFFAKHWPQAELDGLFSLETPTRKVILPIWKDVTAEDVKRFSPILAGRLAISASAGIPAIVGAIGAAIGAAQRQRELTELEGAVVRLRQVDQTLTQDRESAALMGSSEGARLVMESVDSVFHTVETSLTGLNSTFSTLSFSFHRSNGSTFRITAPRGLKLHLGIRSIASNSAVAARLELTIFIDTGPLYDDFTVVESHEFQPSFRDGQIRWNQVGSGEVGTSEELASRAIDILRGQIERLSSR